MCAYILEGANYGLFTSFINMAEAVGDKEAYEFGIYNAAKQLALRLAILRSSSEYFPRCFQVPPWRATKAFHEELNPAFAFQNAPRLNFINMRDQAIYNFTTEGIYPETYEALRRFGGEDYSKIMDLTRLGTLNGMVSPTNNWSAMQNTCGVLTDEALDKSCPALKVMDDIERFENASLLMKEWRGIHIFSRTLPRNYFRSQLLAWIEMRNHKMHLEHWEGMEITSGVWMDNVAEIKFIRRSEKMKLRIAVVQEPSEILLDGVAVAFTKGNGGRIEILPENGGTLKILFA